MSDIGSVAASDGSTLLRMWTVSVSPCKRTLQRHSHIAFEITAVNQGNGIYTVGKREYPMSVGDMFFFPSNEQHYITNIGVDGLAITNLHFEPRYLWGNALDSLSEENINFCFSNSKGFENRISAQNTNELLSIFRAMSDELGSKNPEYSLAVKSLLNFVLIRLIRNFDYAGKRSPFSHRRLHSIRRVLEYIGLNLSSDLSLKSLADIAGMSPNYFSSFFHDISGITLWEYINSKRIEAAMRLITKENSQNIIDIAMICGFNNSTHFNKTFKKVTGMTPTEYRNSDDILAR